MSLHAGTRRALLSTQAGGTNGLLNALIAYWPGNEASGNLLDAHTNALTLTDGNTVTSAAGNVYATARQYTAANSEYHTRGSEALLNIGANDCTFAQWIYTYSYPAVLGGLIMKWIESPSYLFALLPTGFLRLALSADGDVTAIDQTDIIAQIPLNAWSFVLWSYAVGGNAQVYVNNDLRINVASPAQIFEGTSNLYIGSYSDSQFNFNGRIGPTMFWKSAAGGGGVLTAAQRTALYNSGAGLRYDQFTL